MTENWVVIYPFNRNQKEINYISPSNIRASFETRLPKYTYNYFTPILSPLPSLTFYAPQSPPARALRSSEMHVFLVLIFPFVYLFPIYDEFMMNLSQASFNFISM